MNTKLSPDNTYTHHEFVTDLERRQTVIALRNGELVFVSDVVQSRRSMRRDWTTKSHGVDRLEDVPRAVINAAIAHLRPAEWPA